MTTQLIYTINGNVDVSTLDYTQEWEDHIQVEVSLVVEDGQFKPVITKSGYMSFKEIYKDKKTQEVVKENVHLCMMGGFKVPLEQNDLT